MGQVQYIGAANPHSEEVSVSGYQNFIIDATPSEILTLPDAVCSYLVGVEPNWWSPANGWSPPAANPQTGSVAWVYSTYTVTAQNSVVIADPTSGGSFAATLLDATTVGGQNLRFKHPGTANTVTITPAAGQTIDGKSSFVLNAGESVTLYSDGGTKWRLMSAEATGALAPSVARAIAPPASSGLVLTSSDTSNADGVWSAPSTSGNPAVSVALNLVLGA